MPEASMQQVYVVDDDQGMLDSTVWLLESVGLKALPFTSGQDFLQACQSAPDAANACVLLDVRMPGMGGLGVQEEMRRRGLELPIIFVSGHADVPIVVRAFRAGAFDFIEKPYNEQLLLDSVQQALNHQTRPDTLPAQAEAQKTLRTRLDSLTPRERDVFLPLARGYSNGEIAQQLNISIKTVNLYRARVMRRMQAECLPDIVGQAIAAGLLDPLDLRG
ncbi:response regulator transcription factor [Kerstersia similis]|uniref:response regulator transcription factor n=1 Tax=Kerstersia similis TaxID=206505 RepID=UPI0039F0CA48